MARLSALFVRRSQIGLDTSYQPSNQGPAFVADYDGDGKMDLLMTGFPVAPGSTTPPVQGRLLLGDGKGGFKLATNEAYPYLAITDAGREVDVADFNGDGRPDTFLANHGWDYEPFPGGQNLLFLSAGDGKVVDASSRLPQSPAFTHSATFGDIDRDQDLDIFVGVMDGIGPYFLLNDGKGVFTQSYALLPAKQSIAFDLGTLTSCLLADLDNDGNLDLVAGAPGFDFIKVKNSVVLWNQGGSFAKGTSTHLPEPAGLASNHIDLDVQAADLNGDGLKDLIVLSAQASPSYEGWNYQILINQGNRSFVDETAARIVSGGIMGGTPGIDNEIYHRASIKLIDINNDGFMDFVPDGYAGPSQIKLDDPLVWLNDGTGHFTTLAVRDFLDSDDFNVALTEARWMQYDQGWGLVRPFARAGFEQGLMVDTLVPATPMSTGPNGENPALRGAPGFNEQYYLRQHPAVAVAVAAGIEPSGLDAWLKARDVPLALTFAPGATIVGSVAADQMAGREGNETFAGAGGLDTVVYGAPKASYTVTRGKDAWSIQSATDGRDTLVDVERVAFQDGLLALDIDGAAGQAYRIYQAALNRTPDPGGLGFWIGQMDKGSSLQAVAASFVASPEFISLYGAAPTNRQLVERFYQNVLHRPGESAGIDFWVGVLDRKEATVGQVLSGFSESPENQAAALLLIGQGISYTPFGTGA